jgi:ribonuclease P protein component
MDFKRVRRFGRSYAHPLIVLIAFKNQEEALHLGFSASKSIGNAVKRNRSKRVLRAGMQDLLNRISPGWDIVLLARTPIVNANFDEIKLALCSLLTRAQLLMVNNGRKF